MGRISLEASKELMKSIRSIVGKGKGYDRSVARCVRVDKNGTSWVRLLGSDTDTPVNGFMFSTMTPGDMVEVDVVDGVLNVTGNITDPSVGESAIERRDKVVVKLMKAVVGDVTSSISLTLEGIKTQVEKKTDKDKIISTINQTAETILIAASKVNIEGAAIFTSGRLSESSLNSTYDAYGAGAQAEAAAIAAQNTANGANYEEQRIYYRSSSSTAPAAPTSWVTETGDKWASNATTVSNWTRKVSPLTQSASVASGATKYPYLWTCVQRKSVAGTITNSTVLLDDTSTVIDGGTVVTGSLTANKLQAGSLTIGYIDTEDSSTADALLNSNVNVGGRNWMLDTQTYDTWYLDDGITKSDGVVTFPVRSSLDWYLLSYPCLIPIADFTGHTWTLSFDYRSNDFSDTEGYRYIRVCKMYGSTKGDANAPWYWDITGDESVQFTPTANWQRGSITFDGTPDALGSGQSYCGIQFWQHTKNGFQIRRIKLERGNKATDYTQAPDDGTGTFGICTSVDPIYNYTYLVTASNFEKVDGATLTVYFDGISMAGGYTELNVNGTGNYPIMVGSEPTGPSNSVIAKDGSSLTFKYYGNAYWVVDPPGSINGSCSTLAATRTKVVDVYGSFVAMNGTMLSVRFTNGNTYASSSLEINLGGVRTDDIYVDGSTTSSSNTLLLDANTTVTFAYDGDEWNYVSRSDASKTATTFITKIDNGGTKVHDAGDTSNYIHLTSNGTNVYQNNVDVAFWGATARIGATSSEHLTLGSDELVFYGSNGTTKGLSVKQSNTSSLNKAVIGIAGGDDTVSTTDLAGPRIYSEYASSSGASDLYIESGSSTKSGSSLMMLRSRRKWENQSKYDTALIHVDTPSNGSPTVMLSATNDESNASIIVDGDVDGSSITFDAQSINLDAGKWLAALGGYKAKTTLSLSTACMAYGSSQTPYYEKRAGLVIVSGAVKPAANVSAGGSMTIANLPVGFRPVQEIDVLCQGTDNATWLLQILPTSSNNADAGKMTASRYRNGATDAAMTTSTWLPFHVVFPVQ